ncbi:uncharacterized protein [Haliotis cracherodii]|uniref:uncharacterized protein n=1 Tax=Haliotis cracherodii TaxID=6455 RepID=UPI0039ECFF2F
MDVEVKTCNGKCTTVGDFLCNQSEHNHPPEDETRVNFVSDLCKRAREETTQIQALYEEQVTQVDEANIPAMPSFQSVKSALYRHRRKTIPALPRSRSAVDIEDKWSETTDGRPFLLFSDGDDDKILAFSTAEQIQALQEADTLYMDATFTACPGLWDQVYIIHARVIQIVEFSERTKVMQLNFGAAPRCRKRIYREIENRLVRLKDQLQQGDKSAIWYLDACGHLPSRG